MVKNTRKGFIDGLLAFIASERFFILIVAFLVLEALWIALSGVYPMAFDEDFHLGVIRLYAHHISPFWSSHPHGADAFGAVARDPSYLYHWLMSFPYRLIAAFTSDQTIQVLILRFMNIALFAAGLPLYRRLLLRSGASRTIVHMCLALFVLLPIAPLVAAQINYDNLFIPLVALSLLMTIDLARKLGPRKPIDARLLAELIIVGLLTSLVKYAFLPIFVAIAVYVVFRLWRAYPGRKLWSALGRSIKKLSVRARWTLGILLLLSLILFVQRYGVNLAHYHKPVPDCGDALTFDQCDQYGPWHRDQYYKQLKPADADASAVTFTTDWFYGMWFRTFFAVDGPATDFQTRGPLPVPAIGAIVFISLSTIAVLFKLPLLLKKYDRSVLLLFLAATTFYVIVLWLDEYRSFLHTGKPVAINGRYLLPLYPLLLLWGALGVSEFLGRRRSLKLSLAGLLMICMLWGGGALTYILRSSDAWYWPSPAVRGANRAVRHTLGPVTPGYRDPKEFMGTHGT